MYIYGGMLRYGKIFEDLYCLDLSRSHWSKVPTGGAGRPGPRFSHSLSAVEDSLVLLGGCPGDHSGSK